MIPLHLDELILRGKNWVSEQCHYFHSFHVKKTTATHVSATEKNAKEIHLKDPCDAGKDIRGRKEMLWSWFSNRWESLADRLEDMSLAKKMGIVIGILCFFFLAFGLLWSVNSRETSSVDGRNQTIYMHIRSGMSVREIGTQLENRGIIKSSFQFWLTAKVHGYDDKIKSGSYALHTDMDSQEVLDLFVAGKTSRIKFTIPEGYRVRDIAKRLDAEGIVEEKEFLRQAKHYRPFSYIEHHDGTFYDCEGFLFPDTYTFDAGVEIKDILREMSEDFDHRLTKEMRSRAEEEGLSVYELVILASLVEKEAKFEEDRPIIAQVLLKRLEIGMPLQCDSTLQYLRDTPKEEVSLKDTQVDSPYNSYQHTGLPPGPVANPGLASIKAVLYPANTDYLYFVADHDGHNHYSSTYDEHKNLVERYR